MIKKLSLIKSQKCRLDQQRNNLDRVWRSFIYYAKYLSRNYSATEKELLAIGRAVEVFKQYLYGVRFTVVTDHKPLKHQITTTNPARRLDRLSLYDMTIENRKRAIKVSR